jgi:phosphomannomutase
MKIVVDSGNGVAGASRPRDLPRHRLRGDRAVQRGRRQLPQPPSGPEQAREPADLIAKLKETGADLGLAFDGDGDRLGIITREGNNIYPDRQMMLFAQDVLSRVPGAPILFDVKCTQRLAPAIARPAAADDVQDRPLADQGEDEAK